MSLSKSLVANKVNTQADTPEIIYTSPANGNGTLITSFTAANNSTSNKSYKVYIVNKDSSPATPQIPYRIVVWEEVDMGIGVVGQVIPSGGSLHIECNDINSVYVTVTGKEL